MRSLPAQAGVLAMVALACVGCSRQPAPGFLKSGKLQSITVGRSSRTDVFAALGRPVKTETSGLGEAWTYEAKGRAGAPPGLMAGATTASAVAGAFVPYVGLLGTGLGLANTAATSAGEPPDTVSLVVKFGIDGVVQDCLQSSTAIPAGLPGSAAAVTDAVDCRRLPTASDRTP